MKPPTPQPPQGFRRPDPRLHAEALRHSYGHRRALAIARMNTRFAADDYWTRVLSALQTRTFGADSERASTGKRS